MHTIDLTSLTREKNILVISCIECGIWFPEKEGMAVYVHTALGTTLQEEDALLKESILYYIAEKKCNQVIVIGHSDCKALYYILKAHPEDRIVFPLKSKLVALMGQHHIEIAPRDMRSRMLMELNIVRQAEILMSFDFVQRSIIDKKLSVTGVTYDEESKRFNQVFFNGHTLNTLTTMS
jgi:carbonic anhydrase